MSANYIKITKCSDCKFSILDRHYTTDSWETEAASAAAERVRVTVIVDGETPERMREAIAQRVADVGKPTAWADGLCAA